MRTTHAGIVVSAFAVAGAAALVALVVPHVLSGDDSDPAQPTYAPSSCVTPTPSSADADWTICWDD